MLSIGEGSSKYVKVWETKTEKGVVKGSVQSSSKDKNGNISTVIGFQRSLEWLKTKRWLLVKEILLKSQRVDLVILMTKRKRSLIGTW